MQKRVGNLRADWVAGSGQEKPAAVASPLPASLPGLVDASAETDAERPMPLPLPSPSPSPSHSQAKSQSPVRPGGSIANAKASPAGPHSPGPAQANGNLKGCGGKGMLMGPELPIGDGENVRVVCRVRPLSERERERKQALAGTTHY